MLFPTRREKAARIALDTVEFTEGAYHRAAASSTSSTFTEGQGQISGPVSARLAAL